MRNKLLIGITVCLTSFFINVQSLHARDLHDALEKEDYHAFYNLAKKENINRPLKNGTALLHKAIKLAVEKDDSRYAFRLMELGANLETRDKEQNTPIFYTFYTFSTEDNNNHPAYDVLFELIRRGANVNAINKNGDSVLLNFLKLAGKLGDYVYYQKGIRALVSSGANVNYKNPKTGEFPLYFAARLNVEFIKLLLTHGAGVNDKTGEGYNVLHSACVRGLSENVLYLIGMGADVNNMDNKGNTPLMYAINEQGELASAVLVKILIDAGASVNAQNKQGKTALMLAVSGGNISIVRLLLKSKANKYLKDNDNKNAFDYAIKYKKHGALYFLEKDPA